MSSGITACKSNTSLEGRILPSLLRVEESKVTEAADGVHPSELRGEANPFRGRGRNLSNRASGEC